MNDLERQINVRTAILEDSRFSTTPVFIETEYGPTAIPGYTPEEAEYLFTGHEGANLHAALAEEGRALVILPFEAATQAQTDALDGQTVGALLHHHGMIYVAEDPAVNARSGAPLRVDQMVDALLEVVMETRWLEVPQGMVTERPEEELGYLSRFFFFDYREVKRI